MTQKFNFPLEQADLARFQIQVGSKQPLEHNSETVTQFTVGLGVDDNVVYLYKSKHPYESSKDGIH